MKVFVLTLLIAVLSVSAFAQAKSGIEGVWQLTEVTTTGTNVAAMPNAAVMPNVTMKATQPSMYLFTKKHYSIIYVESDKPRMVMDDYSKATQEQLLSIFVEDFIANAGTYEVKAGKVTFHPKVAKSPGYMKEGTWSAYTMKISGNTLTLVSEGSNSGPSKNPTTFKLTRVE